MKLENKKLAIADWEYHLQSIILYCYIEQEQAIS